MNYPINSIITILLFTSIIAGGIYLQLRLSKSDNKFLGLILPAITFVMSLFMALGMTSFGGMQMNHGGMRQMRHHTMQSMGYGNMFFIFLISNIPTVILLAIYSSERKKIKTNKSIEKMKITDL